MAKKRWSGEAKRAVKRYNSYRRAFAARVDDMIESGITPYDGIPLTYREFNEIYAEERNDRLKEIEKGTRKSLGNINAKIISDQVYELSEEQAYSILDYMKSYTTREERKELGISLQNINLAIAKIRQGEFVREDLGLWDIIKNKRSDLFSLNDEEKKALIEKWKKKLIEKGKAPTFKNAVSMEIGYTFFGSP